ncbi:MAG TPA: hypothetical protein PKJ41_08105, partial [Bryobacteraceae bacterium]|nr:hypothetical protein [Bryobacteraceae bacterium]
EIVGAQTVSFNGNWRRDGDTAILDIRNGFSNGGAEGTGRVAIVNNEVQSLTLEGRNRQTSAAFTVEFRGRATGRRNQW